MIVLDTHIWVWWVHDEKRLVGRDNVPPSFPAFYQIATLLTEPPAAQDEIFFYKDHKPLVPQAP